MSFIEKQTRREKRSVNTFALFFFSSRSYKSQYVIMMEEGAFAGEVVAVGVRTWAGGFSATAKQALG